MLEHYQDVSKNVLGEVVMEVFEEPNFPSAADVAFQGSDVMKRGFLAGVGLMIVLLALISYQKDNVKSEEEVTEKLDTTVFGTLNHEPLYRNLRARLKRQKKKILITEPAVSFGFVETIKKMRTKLLYNRSRHHDKVLLVTSAMRKEGKTIVAANLALAMAQRGKKVLLIEGDMRKSSLASFLNVEVPDGAGFSERISHDLESLIFQVPDRSLYLLPNNVAHKRSTEFLGSQRFAEFLNHMREEMDFIIIDGPAAKVEYRMAKNEQKVLVVTSVSENEGKSTVAANLAITLAEQSKRVLLVDGDIRRPSQFLIFGMEPKEENELGEYLRGNGSLADVMVPCTRKHMLFMGGKNCYSSSTEMLNSESFFKLMAACRKFVDYVIIDTPPAGIIGDAQIFAHCADAVMIVSKQNYMLAEDINEVMDDFRDKEGKVLGVVLNGVRSFSGLVDSPVGHYYGKYSKYGRYGNYGRSKGM